MNLIADVPVELKAGVEDFVQQAGVERDLQTFCALACECHPEIVKQEVHLRKDEDEPGRQYLVVYATRPRDFAIDESLRRGREFTRRVVAEFPMPLRALFFLCFLEES